MFRGFGALITGGVAVLLALILFGSMWIFGWGMFQRATADFRGETAALEQIKADPNSRITAYEHFFNLCTAVQSHEGTILALEEELAGDPSDSRREQIQGAITANKSQRDALIRRYNNDANKDYTAGQFRDADLPDQLNINKEVTECVS